MSLTARDPGGKLRCVMFSAGERAGEARGECDLLFAPEINVWQGRASVQLTLKAMEPLDARGRIEAQRGQMGALLFRFLTEMLYNREIDPRKEAVSAADVRAALAASPQGTLLAALDEGQALFLLDMLAEEPPLRFDLEIGAYPQDPRAFNAVCLLPAGAPPRNYRRLIRADDVQGAPRCAWFGELPDVDGLRNAYRALRDILRRPAVYEGLAGLCRLLGAECGLTLAGAGAALLALEDMRLVEINESGARLLPMEKRDPMDSAAVQTLLRLRAEGR